MQLLRLAKSYLRQAEARLRDAEEALTEGNHPYAVRLSQECVELSLKAALKVVGIDYPKVHDVSDENTSQNGSRQRWNSYANQAKSSRKRGR